MRREEEEKGREGVRKKEREREIERTNTQRGSERAHHHTIHKQQHCTGRLCYQPNNENVIVNRGSVLLMVVLRLEHPTPPSPNVSSIHFGSSAIVSTGNVVLCCCQAVCVLIWCLFLAV